MSLRAQDERAQAHRTLTTVLAELYPRTVVRAAAGVPGAWQNAYPPEQAVPVEGMDLDRPVAVHLAVHYRRGHGRRFRFIAFDCDAKTAGAEQAAADARLLSNAAEAEGIPAVPAASGTPGGVHVWTGCVEGVAPAVARRINDAAARLCPSLDKAPLANPQEGLMRPPGAAHRNGRRSTLTAHTAEEAVNLLGPDSAPAEAFERLAVRLETLAAERTAVPDADDETSTGTVPPSIRQRGPRLRRIVEDEAGCPKVDAPWRPLGERALKGLRRPLSRRDDHSAYKHAPARSMALAGWTQAEGLAVVRDAALSPALEWLRSERQDDGRRRPRAAEETERLWARVWSLAVEDAARMPRRPEDDGRGAPSEVQQAVADLFVRMRAAGPARWSRESGPADAATLHALAYVMLLAGTTDVSANIRRLGVLAGYTYQTAALALLRLIKDGWLTITAEAERRAGKARRVTLATSHECTDDHRHRCAIYTAPEDVSPVHLGSDRSGTPPALAPRDSSSSHLRSALTHHQADVWHEAGHHAARTLWTLRTKGPCTVTDLMKATDYTRRTIRRHLHRFTEDQLTTTKTNRRGETTYTATDRALHQAVRKPQNVDRMAALAVAYRVEEAAHEWLTAEEAHRSLPYRERPRRALADQTVIPGMDPRGRAYPRMVNGRPDHARARRIEAQRIGAVEMLAHAQQLTRTGQLLDLPHLSATGANQQSAHRSGGRAVIPSRAGCPHCHANPGERCMTWGVRGGRPAARWHVARRRAAQAQARATE
ncbi:hypothetical protein HW130_32210 [Streptomyces sp. PKU-EA00015]|uniref:zinc finger domain-containing protein n=1 Tax=Streptomyces sp. PKU-EA00015 TaxID=2748326 RepID=UPI0015A35D63|nr:hypothetical protein [Streptomyces sp. PKU-EA00015]NWF30858.1 hypothetical protein [Streptomyces sp. PKU-EA00015]